MYSLFINLTCFHFHHNRFCAFQNWQGKDNCYRCACLTKLRWIVTNKTKKVQNCQSYKMLSTLTCPNWFSSLYNSVTYKMKKYIYNKNNEKRGNRKWKKKTALHCFFPLQECVSAIAIIMFNVETVWLLPRILSYKYLWFSLVKIGLPNLLALSLTIEIVWPHLKRRDTSPSEEVMLLIKKKFTLTRKKRLLEK